MKTCVFAREVSQKTPKRLKRERCRKIKVWKTPTIFDCEKRDYFPRLVLKGRRSPVPKWLDFGWGSGAAWESKF